MRLFKVSFTVSVSLLPTIVGLLTQEVGKLSIEEVEGGAPASPIHKPTTQPIEKRRSRAAILDLFYFSENITVAACRDAMETAGLSRNTASPTLSRLRQEGLIKSVGPQTYAKA